MTLGASVKKYQPGSSRYEKVTFADDFLFQTEA